MKADRMDRMSLELYSDLAVIRLSDGETDVTLYLDPKTANTMGVRLQHWALGDRRDFTPCPTEGSPR